jgi:beta-phosphoglucomutase family hydrolase
MAKAVLWDLDGVLVDTAAHHFRAWRTLFRELGRDLSEEDFRRTFGLRNDAILRTLVGDLPREEAARLSRHKEELYRQGIAEGLEPMPGVVELLHRLQRRGRGLAIVSSTPRENVDVALRSLGLTGLFDTVVAEEDVRRGKPNPEGYLLAAERLGMMPSECVVIEDAPGGVEAARRAGMRCVGLAADRPERELAKADLVVRSLEDAVVAAFLGLE